MNKKIKNADIGGCVPYAGSGKLSDFKKDGSWIMNQIEKGYDNVERGVIVDKSGDYIKFANTKEKIASRVLKASINFQINKYYKKTSENEVALMWKINSNLDGINLTQLGLMQELLNIQKNNDIEKIYISNFISKIIYYGQSLVDFNNKCIKTQVLLQTKNFNNKKSFLQTLDFQEMI